MTKPTRSRRQSKSSRPPLTVTIPGLVQSGRDADFREMVGLMYAALGRLQTMRRTLARSMGLSSAEFAVVMAVRRLENESGVRIRRIADDLYVAAANVTATVGRLEESGWVVKTSDPTDSRALGVRLSKRARNRVNALLQELHFVNDVWFRGTTGEELQAIISFYRRLIAQYRAALNKARELTGVQEEEDA